MWAKKGKEDKHCLSCDSEMRPTNKHSVYSPFNFDCSNFREGRKWKRFVCIFSAKKMGRGTGNKVWFIPGDFVLVFPNLRTRQFSKCRYMHCVPVGNSYFARCASPRKFDSVKKVCSPAPSDRNLVDFSSGLNGKKKSKLSTQRPRREALMHHYS